MSSCDAPTPAVTVVIATRNRIDLLQDCVAALLANDHEAFELLLVDDAASGPDLASLFADPRVRTFRAGGIGTSAARNIGIEAARAPVVAFTDDDTVPAPTWVGAIVSALEGSDAVGVEGPVVSDPWDPLYAHSIEADGPGNSWTANVAYRTAPLREVGGFDVEKFPVYGEDRDLAFRMEPFGPIAWAPGMSVVHKARAMTLRDFRVPPGRTHADLELLTRMHPNRRRWHRLRIVIWTGRRWWRLRELPEGTSWSPRRAARFLAVGVVRLTSTARATLRVPSWVHDAWARVADAPRP